MHAHARHVDFSVKTVTIGDSGVGKSCLLTRFIRDYFDEGSPPTLGVEFMAKIVETEKRQIELQFWDTAGQELFRAVTRGYYRGSSVAYLVFDMTSRQSFESLDRWLKDIKEVTDSDIITILIGNKSDLARDRQVTRDEAEAFAKTHHMKYFEVSAKTGDGITEAIKSCLPIIDERADKGRFSTPMPSESIIYDNGSNNSGCC